MQLRKYNARFVRAPSALLAPFCAAGLWAQAIDFRLEVDFRQERPVDRLIAKTDPVEDVWIGEQDYQSVDSELKLIAKSLLEDPSSFEPLSRVTAGFRGLGLAEFKIVGTRREGVAGDLVRVAVRVELGGEFSDGSYRSTLGAIEMSWAHEAGEWALRSVDTGEFRDVRSEAFGFTEITDQVFGHIDSFREQLALDIDHWRGSLDAALGVSIYGHHGISLGDFDGDGLEDLYISQPGGLPNRLYRSNGDGTFSDASRRAGLDILDDTSMSLFADIDTDGDQDLILIGAAPLLYRNHGNGRFLFDASAGLDVPEDKAAMFTGAAMADYDLDGDIDLFVCAYDFWQAGSEYDAPTPYYDAVNGPANLLFRNDGNGTFTEVSDEVGFSGTNDRFSFAAAWGDYDNDGDPDLYVANDFGRNNLYSNNGDGTFTDMAGELGVEDLGAGMSAAWGDYDNDGDLDLYTSNMWSSAGLRITNSGQFDEVAPADQARDGFRRQAQGNSLFRNDGSRGFTDVSEEARVRTGRWAWASDFVDLDSDGLLDLFVQNGYITGARTDDL